jgi:hypothetical protein
MHSSILQSPFFQCLVPGMCCGVACKLTLHQAMGQGKADQRKLNWCRVPEGTMHLVPINQGEHKHF